MEPPSQIETEDESFGGCPVEPFLSSCFSPYDGKEMGRQTKACKTEGESRYQRLSIFSTPGHSSIVQKSQVRPPFTFISLTPLINTFQLRTPCSRTLWL